MRLPREGGDMRLPGEGPHEVGIDRKSNGARRRCCGGSVRSTLHEAPHEVGIDRKSNGARRRCCGDSVCSTVHEAPHEVGIDRKANRRLAADASAVHSHRPVGGVMPRILAHA
jgi:hypothetical protein